MGIPCVIPINYVEANIIANDLKTTISLIFSHVKTNEYSSKEGTNIVS